MRGGLIILFLLFLLSLLKGSFGAFVWIMLGVVGLGLVTFWFIGLRSINKHKNATDIPLEDDETK